MQNVTDQFKNEWKSEVSRPEIEVIKKGKAFEDLKNFIPTITASSEQVGFEKEKSADDNESTFWKSQVVASPSASPVVNYQGNNFPNLETVYKTFQMQEIEIGTQETYFLDGFDFPGIIPPEYSVSDVNIVNAYTAPSTIAIDVFAYYGGDPAGESGWFLRNEKPAYKFEDGGSIRLETSFYIDNHGTGVAPYLVERKINIGFQITNASSQYNDFGDLYLQFEWINSTMTTCRPTMNWRNSRTGQIYSIYLQNTTMSLDANAVTASDPIRVQIDICSENTISGYKRTYAKVRIYRNAGDYSLFRPMVIFTSSFGANFSFNSGTVFYPKFSALVASITNPAIPYKWFTVLFNYMNVYFPKSNTPTLTGGGDGYNLTTYLGNKSRAIPIDNISGYVLTESIVGASPFDFLRPTKIVTRLKARNNGVSFLTNGMTGAVSIAIGDKNNKIFEVILYADQFSNAGARALLSTEFSIYEIDFIQEGSIIVGSVKRTNSLGTVLETFTASISTNTSGKWLWLGSGSLFNSLTYGLSEFQQSYFRAYIFDEFIRYDLPSEVNVEQMKISSGNPPANWVVWFRGSSGFLSQSVAGASPAIFTLTVPMRTQTIWIAGLNASNFEQINEVYLWLNRILKATSFGISRKRDYRISRILAGELNVSSYKDDETYSINDQIYVRAGYNNEWINLFYGFIDRITTNEKTKVVDLKLRDRMKFFSRKTINFSERLNKFIKEILDLISTDCNIGVGYRSFDNPAIALNYWSPIDQNAFDECQLLVEATVDSDLYCDENGIVNFRSYVPGISLAELWDNDIDWNTKTVLNNFGVRNNQLVLPLNAETERITTATTWDIGIHTLSANPYKFESRMKLKATEFGMLTKFSTDFKAGFSGDSTTPVSANMNIKLYNAGGGLVREINVTLNPVTRDSYWVRMVNTVDLSPYLLYYATDYLFDITMSWEWIANGGSHYFNFESFNSAVYGLIISPTAVTGFIVDPNQTWYSFWLKFGAGYIYGFSGGFRLYSSIKSSLCPSTALTFESSNVATNPATWGLFEIVDSGHAFSYYARTSADGITWSAPVAVNKNVSFEGVVAKTAYTRWGVTLSVTDPYFYLDLARMNWFIGGGSDRFTKSVVLEITDPQIIDMKTLSTDEIGGTNALINYAEVKSQPRYQSGVSETVWQGTYNGNPISGSNPLTISTPTTFVCDLDDNVSEPTQAVVESHGGTCSVSFTAHSSKPTIVLTPSGSASFTDLRITGKRIIQQGNIVSIASNIASINAYGEAKESIQNDYIEKITIADAIAQIYIRYYKDPRFIMDATVKFCPHLQLGDRIRINSSRAGILKDFIVMEISHNISTTRDGFSGSTALKLWEIR